MTTRVILSALASDRPGLTSELAEAIQAAGGNWLESHLSRLGGSYVGSILVELPEGAREELERRVRTIDAAGLHVSIAPADRAAAETGPLLAVDLIGQDRPGIVREVTAVLAQLGVNIESFDTAAEIGAWQGESLFRASALVALPDGVSADDVQQALEAISGEVMVDFTFGRSAP